MPPGKRNAGDAGPSWRKWGEPPTAPGTAELGEPTIVYAPVWRRYPFGFWAFWIAAGAVAGLWFVGVAR